MSTKSFKIRTLAVSAAAIVLGATIGVNADSGDTSSSLSGTRRQTTRAEVESICHATGSNENPYVTVTDNGKGHLRHDGDIIPAPAAGCPTGQGTSPTANPEPVTMLLFGAGMSGVAYVARRRKAKQSAE